MLGAIADDFTGATDLATMLRRSGHRVAVVIEDGGIDNEALAAVDAVVVALKTRSIAPAAAAAASLDALHRLQSWGADRFYVKYCSTFDSTAAGNIGPVLDAVTEALGSTRCVVAPSLPANGRTVYQGHLFVGSDLLENSSMRHHPLTPMRQSRVASLLRPQTAHEVGEVLHDVVRSGVPALRAALESGTARYVVIDALSDADLATIASAASGDVVVSGGSGLALGFKAPGGGSGRPDWTAPEGAGRVVLCGSASAATRQQIAHAELTEPVRLIDVEAAARDAGREVAALADWIAAQPADRIPVVCAARELSDLRTTVDGSDAAAVVETVLASLARRLVDTGSVTRLIVAGGESSGAVVGGLGIQALEIGPEIAPGVCWARAASSSGQPVTIALKSGNFGRDDLFTAAWKLLA